LGNTTAAIGKGFAIASAALTALALFAADVDFTGIEGINIFKAKVLAALFLGGMIPVVFSAFAMQSVGRAAMDMVQEVRRQFREIPGLLEGTGKADYERCVEISTAAALREMLPPGLITIVTSDLVGFIMGPEALGGYMAGVTVSGVMWAIFQSNAGGAWDNAKKSFEKGVDINGQTYYKGSDPHKAAVTGDTVGDPFKDTSGPSTEHPHQTRPASWASLSLRFWADTAAATRQAVCNYASAPTASRLKDPPIIIWVTAVSSV
jgi:K(+)-stimulated pyrophosphate-energized sodium pump